MIMLIAGVVVAFFLGLRLLSGEDNWRCRNGQWIEHGVSDAPLPEEPCVP
ncbi:MAG: hypothetical protein Q7S23_05795 [bacterium]|nr:hypothetical protein [bacterium]